MAYEFTAASSQYLSFTNPVGAPLDSLTVACWAKLNNATAIHSLIFIGDTQVRGLITQRDVLFARGDLAGDPIQMVSGGAGFGQGEANTTTGFSANTWFHAAGIETSTGRSAFLNGGGRGDDADQNAFTLVNGAAIGARINDGTAGVYADGLIAEVGIWNVALTTAEIASLAKGMTCDKVRPQSLVFYAPLIRNLQDVRGGLTITNNNTATVANHPRVYA
jgi:hypothetical protein